MVSSRSSSLNIDGLLTEVLTGKSDLLYGLMILRFVCIEPLVVFVMVVPV